MLAHFLRQLHEQATTLHGAELAPGAVEGGPGGFYGGVNVGGLAAWDLIEHLSVRRVEHVDGLAGQGRGGLVGDEVHLHGAIVNPGRILKITHGTSTFATEPGTKKGPPKRACQTLQRRSGAVNLHDQRHDQQRHDVDDLDQWVDRRASGVLVRVTHRISGHGRFVGV